MSPYPRNLFGEEIPPENKKITILSIEAKYRKEVVREDAPAWVSMRFTSARQVFEMFYDLRLLEGVDLVYTSGSVRGRYEAEPAAAPNLWYIACALVSFLSLQISITVRPF